MTIKDHPMVNGLERFYELRDLQRRKQRDKENREKEVFKDGS